MGSEEMTWNMSKSTEKRFDYWQKQCNWLEAKIFKGNSAFIILPLFPLYSSFKVLINNDFLKHKQANINVKSRRFGIIII